MSVLLAFNRKILVRIKARQIFFGLTIPKPVPKETWNELPSVYNIHIILVAGPVLTEILTHTESAKLAKAIILRKYYLMAVERIWCDD